MRRDGGGLPPGTRVLGLDPGLKVTGYGLIEAGPSGPILLEAGVLRGQGRELPDRLNSLHQPLVELIEQYRPRVVVVEQLYAHYAHPRTAILMAHARGVLFLAAGQHQVPVTSYMATRIKKVITGNGHAAKDQVQRTIQQEFELAELPEPSDVADALAAALCHYYVHRPRILRCTIRPPEPRAG